MRARPQSNVDGRFGLWRSANHPLMRTRLDCRRGPRISEAPPLTTGALTKSEPLRSHLSPTLGGCLLTSKCGSFRNDIVGPPVTLSDSVLQMRLFELAKSLAEEGRRGGRKRAKPRPHSAPSGLAVAAGRTLSSPTARDLSHGPVVRSDLAPSLSMGWHLHCRRTTGRSRQSRSRALKSLSRHSSDAACQRRRRPAIHVAQEKKAWRLLSLLSLYLSHEAKTKTEEMVPPEKRRQEWPIHASGLKSVNRHRDSNLRPFVVLVIGWPRHLLHVDELHADNTEMANTPW